MQRILLFFVLLVSLFPTVAGVAFASDCTGVGDSVAGCLSQHASAVESAGGITLENYTIEGGVRGKIISVANNIIMITSLLSVGAIVFAGFWMVTAYGEDETLKKGKNSLKWGVGGLLVSLLSFAIVNAVVNVFYSIG